MAEGLDEIVQKILLEGDVQVINQLGELGKAGFETFEQLAEAAAKGASGMELFATSTALVVTALAGVAGAVGAFVESQAEAIQQSNLLAKSFGATTAQISGLEAAFASAGVSTSAFEQYAQRLTTTVARQWPAIAESIRLSSTTQEQAQERVVAATLRVQDAQNNLLLVDQRTTSQLTSSALSVQSALLQLGENSSKTYQQMVHDQDSAASAGLSLEAAQQRLAALEGRPPSDAEKKNLEIEEARLAVQKAQQAQSDALQAQQDHAQEAALKRQQLEQAAADAELKHEAAIDAAATARQKAELAVREAITARQEAEDRAAQAALKDIPSISRALQGMIDGNKEAAKAIDITQVSVQNLQRGLIAAASAANGGGLPTGLQTLKELSALLSSEQGKLISESQRLALVMTLGQQRMQQTGASASELLGVLSRGPGIFSQFNEAADKAFSNSSTAEHNVEHFKDAFEQLSYTIQLVNRDLAASSLPVFTQALDAIRESLTSSTGLLHGFVEGIKTIGSAIGLIISGAQALFAAIDRAFDLEKGRSFQIVLVAILALVGTFASAWLAIPATIALVVTAIGLVATAAYTVAENWDKIKTAVANVWKAIQDSSVYKFLDGVVEKVKAIVEWLLRIPAWFRNGNADGKATAASTNNTVSGDNTVNAAGGGEIRGRGTKTSDSIPARLSHGEFVQSAAAVDFWGTEFMHAINRREFPGLAAGGTLTPGSRPGSAGPMPASSVLNLTIGEQTFYGLRGPKDVVDSLAAHAVSRQTSSAGRKPSWVK